jgi:hypothetical protein
MPPLGGVLPPEGATPPPPEVIGVEGTETPPTPPRPPTTPEGAMLPPLEPPTFNPLAPAASGAPVWGLAPPGWALAVLG